MKFGEGNAQKDQPRENNSTLLQSAEKNVFSRQKIRITFYFGSKKSKICIFINRFVTLK